MANGVWTMDGEGNFALSEEYAKALDECKVAATRAWTMAIVEFLSERTDYEPQLLADELLRRNRERGGAKGDILEGFVLEALSGDL